jgi:hypothetical protein
MRYFILLLQPHGNDAIKVHASISSERHTLVDQLSPLLVWAFWKIRKPAIRFDHTIRQLPMTVVCRAPKQ